MKEEEEVRHVQKLKKMFFSHFSAETNTICQVTYFTIICGDPVVQVFGTALSEQKVAGPVSMTTSNFPPLAHVRRQSQLAWPRRI